MRFETFFIALWAQVGDDDGWLPCDHSPFLSYRAAMDYAKNRKEEDLHFKVVEVVEISNVESR